MSKPANFSVSPSFLGRIAVGGVYLLVMLMVALLAPPWPLAVCLVVVLITSAFFVFRKLVWRYAYQLSFDGEHWHCSNCQQAMCLKAYYLLPGIISLQFSLATQNSKRLLLFSDSLAPEQWCNIRRICRGF